MGHLKKNLIIIKIIKEKSEINQMKMLLLTPLMYKSVFFSTPSLFVFVLWFFSSPLFDDFGFYKSDTELFHTSEVFL